MNDVIDRIAIAAEKNPRNNVLFGYCGKYGDNLMTPEEERTGISSERIYELNQELCAKGQLVEVRHNKLILLFFASIWMMYLKRILR